MSELGQMLRKARLDRKISLEDLQEMTKIRKRYLEAIEDGNFKVLPGNFYVRAFIKSYAEAVGLDPNEVLQLYQNVLPAQEQEQIEPIRTKRTSRNSEKIGKWASNVMMISFVVLILGAIYYYLNTNYSGGQRDANVNEEPKRVTDKVETANPSVNNNTYQAQAADNAVVPATPPPTPPPPQAEVKLVKSQGGTDYYAVSNASKLTIEMKVTGDACWFQIDSLGEKKDTLEQGTYTNGKSQKWELDNSAFMIFGRSNAVELLVNGTAVTVGDTPNAKRIQFDLQKS